MEVTRGGRPERTRARLLRVVQLGARSRHALGVALVGHFLRSAMRRAGRQAAEQQAVWPARLAAVSACREGAAAPDRARNRAALWRKLRPHLHHVLDVLCRQLALHLHLGGVNLLLIHCAHTPSEACRVSRHLWRQNKRRWCQLCAHLLRPRRSTAGRRARGRGRGGRLRNRVCCR